MKTEKKIYAPCCKKNIKKKIYKLHREMSVQAQGDGYF